MVNIFGKKEEPKPTDREARKAALENATIKGAEIQEKKHYLGETNKAVIALIDQGRQAEANPYINDAAATEKEIEMLEKQKLTYERAAAMVPAPNAMPKVAKNDHILGQYFGSKAVAENTPVGDTHATVVEELGEYQQQRNLNGVVSYKNGIADKNQLTPEGQTYLSRIMASRDTRNRKANDLQGKIDQAAAAAEGSN